MRSAKQTESINGMRRLRVLLINCINNKHAKICRWTRMICRVEGCIEGADNIRSLAITIQVKCCQFAQLILLRRAVKYIISFYCCYGNSVARTSLQDNWMCSFSKLFYELWTNMIYSRFFYFFLLSNEQFCEFKCPISALGDEMENLLCEACIYSQFACILNETHFFPRLFRSFPLASCSFRAHMCIHGIPDKPRETCLSLLFVYGGQCERHDCQSNGLAIGKWRRAVSLW